MATRILRPVWRGVVITSILLITATEAAKTFSLPFTELHERSYEGADDLEKRQATSGDGVRTTDVVWNGTRFSFFVDVAVGNENANFKLSVIQNPFTWLARRWNETFYCHPVDNCAASNISGFFSFIEPATSTSYANLTEDFDIEYADFRYARGDWVQDSFRLGQTTINDVNFGVVHSYNATPVLGLGPGDSSVNYPTFLQVMKAKDMINTETFGFYFNDFRQRDDSGKSITFGGIDTAKFDGPLKTYKSSTGDAVEVIGVNIVRGGEIVNTPFDPATSNPKSASVSFGTPSLHLPTSIWNAMIQALEIPRSNIVGGLPSLEFVPPDDFGLEIMFSQNLTIFLPFAQMLLPPEPGYSWYNLLALDSGREESMTLGNPFFRGAYVFFDYTNSEISLASALFNATSQSVVEVGVNGESVTALGLDSPTPTVTPTIIPPPPLDTTSPNPQSSSSGPPIAPIVGGAVGGVALLAILGGGFWFYRRRRARGAQNQGQFYPTEGGYPPPQLAPSGPMNETFKSPLPHVTPVSPVVSPASPHSTTKESVWSPMSPNDNNIYQHQATHNGGPARGPVELA